MADADLRALALLLTGAVESGAAVSFLARLTRVRAEDWRRKTLAASDPGAVFLAARDADGIVGTVQLHPAAEYSYRRIGSTHAGTIARPALDPDGTPRDAVIFCKELTQVGDS